MSWTQADLTALEAAIRTGTRQVTYADRTVVYRDLSEMLTLRDIMTRDVAGESPASRTRVAGFRGRHG